MQAVFHKTLIVIYITKSSLLLEAVSNATV